MFFFIRSVSNTFLEIALSPGIYPDHSGDLNRVQDQNRADFFTTHFSDRPLFLKKLPFTCEN